MVEPATAYTYRRRDLLRKHRVVMMRMPCVDGNTTAVFPTGLKLIYSYTVSPPSVATRNVTAGTISGGTITLALGNTGNASVLYLTAYGI